jgi:hypothetical protein
MQPLELASAVAASAACLAEQGETPTVYITQHVLSQYVAGAFAQGCKAETVLLPEFHDKPSLNEASRRLMERGLNRPGPIAVYGILRGCGEVINFAKWTKQDWWHIDNGYVRHTDLGSFDGTLNSLRGYYRITKNGFQNTEHRERPPDRWDRLQHPFSKKWRTEGRNILVIPPSGFVSKYQGIEPEIWKRAVEEEIKKHTDRPVKVKVQKGGLEEFLPDTFCVVTHESMAALHSQINGVPSIALGSHCLGNLSWTWKDLEYPNYRDRIALLKRCHALAYDQFSLDEMRRGDAWKILND